MLTHLVGTTPTLAADFDDNLLVDQNDLALWQIGFGTTGDAAHREGDSDADRDADGHDFMSWQQQWGGGGLAIAKPQAVPEPSNVAFLICLVGLFVWDGCRERRRCGSQDGLA
jgi:hypothetical protein